MTIKEIEALSAMTRANIRFYEAEGLLTPRRSENGYRNYSDEDLDILNRIKLLRSLHIPLEEIKALHQDKEELHALLSRHIAVLGLEQQNLNHAQQVCQEICRDGADYHSLDTQRYLDALNRLSGADTAALANDVLPTVKAPLRRFLARILDLQWYNALWSVFLILVCHQIHRETTPDIFFDESATIALMLCMEPILLHFFGTTPGKWLLGLSVTDPYGQRLSLSAALDRTWAVLWRGMGLNIPLYSLYRLNESHQACEKGEPLCWEQDSILILHDKKKWRVFAYVLAYAASVGAVILSTAIAVTPPYRGDITPEEFYANFNHAALHQNIDLELNSSGHWIENFPAYDRDKFHLPDFVIREINGVVTEVIFHYETTDNTLKIPNFQEPMLLAGLAFAGAQDGSLFFSGTYDKILQTIRMNEFNDFTFSAGDITFRCEVERSGYERSITDPGFLLPKEGAKTSFSLDFIMVKHG